MKTFTIISMGALAVQEPCDALKLKKLSANASAPITNAVRTTTGGCNNIVIPGFADAMPLPAASGTAMEHVGMWGKKNESLAGVQSGTTAFPDTIEQYEAQLDSNEVLGKYNTPPTQHAAETCGPSYNVHRGIFHYDETESNPFERLARDYGFTLNSEGFQFTDPEAAVKESGAALSAVRGMLRMDADSCNKISFRKNFGYCQNHEIESALYAENIKSIMRRAAEALHKAPENPETQLNVALTKLYASGLMRAYGYNRRAAFEEPRHRQGTEYDKRTVDTELADALDMIKMLPAEVSDPAQPRIAQAYLEVIEAALGNYLSLETIEAERGSRASWWPDMLTRYGGNKQRALWLIDGIFSEEEHYFPNDATMDALVHNYLRAFVQRKAANDGAMPLKIAEIFPAMFEEDAANTALSPKAIARGMARLMTDVLERRVYASAGSMSWRPRRFRGNPGVCERELEKPWEHCQMSLQSFFEHSGHGEVDRAHRNVADASADDDASSKVSLGTTLGVAAAAGLLLPTFDV